MAVIHHCLYRPLASTTFWPNRLGRVWPLSFSHTHNNTTPPPSSPPYQPNTSTRISSQIGVAIDDSDKVRLLKHKMELLDIKCDDFVTPGRYHHLYCPKCKGGQSMVRSLSLHIIQDGGFAMWRCFHTECGWAGQVFADGRAAYNGVGKKVNSSGQISEESLGLEPLGAKVVWLKVHLSKSEIVPVAEVDGVLELADIFCCILITYFAERMISAKTLRRNAVMQLAADKNVIAFTYRQNGLLVGCKYRTIKKRFWQEKGTEKMLYGIDDINDVAEIIIVEGEIDKLSLEEAGFCNCVSVPAGAPEKVSTKELPSVQKDLAYQYLWNCKENLDKVSRIILATDGDISGQALAEELARRLGKDRCWQVRWPKKDDSCCFKDANEV
uniref:Toprim domain-containing protein n=1 Tax=Fagus sylvatica TaxID=28930 RepID=A0A2N9ITH4_FAGSY